MKALWKTIWSWFRSFFAPPPTTLKVGFLSPVKQQEANDFLTAFKLGLGVGDPVSVVPKYGNGKYGPGERTLVDLAKELMTGPDAVQVVAAVGGLTCLQAAVQAANETASRIPIIFISDKDITNPNISGGLVLQMPSYDPQRVEALRNRYGATKVGLLVNLNAVIGPDEKNRWDINWGPVRGVSGPNDHINLQQAITDLVGDGATGIVVASDSFFTSQAAPLVAHLNHTDKPVCYPFQSYKNTNPRPTTGKSMRYGVDLQDQYKALGKKARDVLNALIAHPGKIPNVGVDQITSTPDYW